MHSGFSGLQVRRGEDGKRVGRTGLRLVRVGGFLMVAGFLLLASCGTTDSTEGSETASSVVPSGTLGTGSGVSTGVGTGTSPSGTSGTTSSGTSGSSSVCGPCPGVVEAVCDDLFAVVTSLVPGPDCTCVEEIERTNCQDPLGNCLDGACVECVEDRDCPEMGRPQCQGSNLITNRGRCGDNRCSIVGVPSFCEFGCEEGECLQQDPCPDAFCEGTPGAPFCEDDVWVTPVLVPDAEDCERCVEVEQRWLCGRDEVCEPDGCVVADCDPCPVFDPPPPFCEGDVAVQATGYELDPVTCVCTETFRRTDCTETSERCSDGLCVPR